MAGTIILSDEEVEIEVEEHQREANEEREDEYELRQSRKKRKKRESEQSYVLGKDDNGLHHDNVGSRRPKAVSHHFYEDQVNEDVLEMAIEHMRENPDWLKRLDVDEYARSKNFENKKETLNHIRLELIQGFLDWRKPYTQPSKDEELYMITGETEETLFEGKIVQVTVRRVQPQKAICVLDSGLTGLLDKYDCSYYDLTKKLRAGDILTCRIKSIQKARHGVFLSCIESDLRSGRSQNSKPMDPYYHEDRDNLVDPVRRSTHGDRVASLEVVAQRQGEELREAMRMLRAICDHHGIRVAHRGGPGWW